jgi:DNA polymerase III beta subunit, central domain
LTNIIEIPVADLLRVTPFMATDDVRCYLNGMLVTPYKDHALLVATNGHWMGVYESETAKVDKPHILDLPKWFATLVGRAERGENLEDGTIEGVEFEDDPTPEVRPKWLKVETEKSHLAITDLDHEVLVKPGAAFIDGKFPKWQSVIPDVAKLERGLFGAFAVNYLADLHLAVPNEREHPLFCYQSRAGGPAVFRFGNLPGLVAVLMPRRDDDKESAWPKWMSKPTQE